MRFVRFLIVVSAIPVAMFAESPANIASAAFKSVVLLTVNDSDGRPLALGSGFFVGEGVIATNAHVLEGAYSGSAKLVGESRVFRVLGILARDSHIDLALLKVDGSAPVLKLAQSESPIVGDRLYVVGSPMGLEGTFSEGIVSGVRRLDDHSLLQMTAPISPGSSGGPVLNEAGEVIGIAVATFESGQNLNFAIPVPYLLKLLSSPAREPIHLGSGSNPDKHFRSDSADLQKLIAECARGLGGSCRRAGKMIDWKGGTGQDSSRAADLYRQACDLDDGEGCGLLGGDYDIGRGVPRDDLAAVALSQKGCDLGGPRGCGFLTACYGIGGCGFRLDHNKMLTYGNKACSLGDSWACEFLGDAFRDGDGVARDLARARHYYLQACNKGSREGCTKLKAIQ